MLTNLVDNGIKFGREGGTVTIRYQANERDQISIEDNGDGIPAQHLERLFERFYRVDKDRSRTSPGGTGLGLAICKHIIEAHKGKISVESTPGIGSIFSFTLRVQPD